MDSCYLILGIVIFGFLLFGLIGVCSNRTEGFSPTGWSANCPPASPRALSPNMANGLPWRKPGWISVDGDYIAGSYSPGSAFKCDNEKDCVNLKTSGCKSKKEDVPEVVEDLPLGWGSSMTGPYADNWAMSGVNGINKATLRNPYGRVYPKGKQMYGFLEKGSRNCFDA